jgi:bifunctional enzyme Fae/Hps
MILSRKQRYLQIALNSTMDEAYEIIANLPRNDRIIIEAGTPLIKEYGMDAIRKIYELWSMDNEENLPYIVADLKTMDRAETEVKLAKNAGASAAICLGQAPLETINSFIATCANEEIDSMLDMMNIEYPVKLLRQLRNIPDVVILHRGVDEEKFNKNKPIPYVQINKVLSGYNVLISIAGGDTLREVQRAVFNGANIVVVWKEFFTSSENTGNLANEFLKEIK